jgi:hypothetical protein
MGWRGLAGVALYGRFRKLERASRNTPGETDFSFCSHSQSWLTEMSPGCTCNVMGDLDAALRSFVPVTVSYVGWAEDLTASEENFRILPPSISRQHGSEWARLRRSFR